MVQRKKDKKVFRVSIHNGQTIWLVEEDKLDQIVGDIAHCKLEYTVEELDDYHRKLFREFQQST